MICDAVILAGGRATPEMAAKTGTNCRALFMWECKPFVQWVYEALRASDRVDRIAIVGPERLKQTRPDFVLVLPWNLSDEIAAEHAYVSDWGGRFVVAVPGVRLLT